MRFKFNLFIICKSNNEIHTNACVRTSALWSDENVIEIVFFPSFAEMKNDITLLSIAIKLTRMICVFKKCIAQKSVEIPSK